MTRNVSFFSKLRQHNGERVIITNESSTYPVMKKKINVDNANVKLDNVYHVPGLKKNLVLVFQITSFGKYVLFGSNEVKVFDNVRNVVANVFLVGEKKDSLFVMSTGEAYVKKTNKIDSATIGMLD